MDVSLRGHRHVLHTSTTESNRTFDDSQRSQTALFCSRVNVVGTPRTETGLAREVTPEYDPQFQLEGHGHVSPPTQSCPSSG